MVQSKVQQSRLFIKGTDTAKVEGEQAHDPGLNRRGLTAHQPVSIPRVSEFSGQAVGHLPAAGRTAAVEIERSAAHRRRHPDHRRS
jgi:hypothetical protein